MIAIQQAHERYTDDGPGHDSDHPLRVLTLTERIDQAEGTDLDILRVADKL
jgi:HD superfamily phosphodiesterase